MVIFFTRHAEKADIGTNPPISNAGRARAKVLAHILTDTKLEAVYVTQFLRTQMTGETIAEALDLVDPVHYDAGNPAEVITKARNEFPDGSVLIIGHSNTLDDIANELGIPSVPELEEHQFDRLFAIHIHEHTPHLQRLRYGTPTP
ncbi:histidine phosphatase family protein [Ruegeria sp. HKCCD8929]|uniref:SixA phosphatase family protein n=1 Tax=Ruegeria sp. HKCCD8929 TaxID=2683006 RepID=UPI0014889213|nr:phosphoglycerate mutase family protein [Ruegeria sp. HKCCD8929]